MFFCCQGIVVFTLTWLNKESFLLLLSLLVRFV